MSSVSVDRSKIHKNLGFELASKTSNRKQDILNLLLGVNDVTVTVYCLNLYIPTIKPRKTKVFYRSY